MPGRRRCHAAPACTPPAHATTLPRPSPAPQSLLNGNLSALSAARLGDAKSIPAVDVMLADGFPAATAVMAAGLDIRLGAGAGQQGAG